MAQPLPRHSRFFQRLERRYEADLDLLPPGPPTRQSMTQAFDVLLARTPTQLGAALRILRQLVMQRLIALDSTVDSTVDSSTADGPCSMPTSAPALFPLEHVTSAVTELAELALDRACQHVRMELDTRHGAPLGPQGQEVPLWIVGMGKLGARELNVSSDIDLIYVYEHEGETAGQTG